MFDPTAFDNMKVIVEGALYDRDLSGEIIIIDRNDIINMAKMSRHFNISFSIPQGKPKAVLGKIELESQLAHLSAELLPSSQTEQLIGSLVKLYFTFDIEEDEIDYYELNTILFDLWGTSRKITLSIQHEPLQPTKKEKGIITVDFERLITEDQMDDLVEMTDVMITTQQKLTEYLNK
ncbi:hypothetical protein ABES03_13060 [Neobacillus rhizosphaerae]|uniref:hypothetical protein n=1 Tax=Neobacillus rhizosphaerae TaxID=2880965 RepID=UPI003D269543